MFARQIPQIPRIDARAPSIHPVPVVVSSELVRQPEPVVVRFWELAALVDGWAGVRSPKPNAHACENAHRILDLSRAAGRLPDTLVPDVMGGIGLYWYGTELREDGSRVRFASVNCDNDGDVTALTRDQREVGSSAWSVEDLREAVDRALAFARG